MKALHHDLPSPSDLGAPAKYAEWRAGQGESFEALVGDKRRVQVLALPTGVGKSLVVAAYAAFTGKRTVVLTANKGLQDQYVRDYREIGMTDVRGMSNYPCLAEGGNCDEGSCLDGGACHLKELGCEYFDAVRRAERASIVVTNYAFWLTRRRTFQGLGKVDVLVCDEAHDIDGELGRFLSISFGAAEVQFPPDADSLDVEGWRLWAKTVSPSVKRDGSYAPKWARRKARETATKIDAVENLRGDRWVIARTPAGGWTFEPLWTGPYVESWLFQGIEKVILASATIRPQTVERLGVSKEDFNFIEPKSPIPVSRRPVIHVESGVRVNHRTPRWELMKVIRLMDEAHEARSDRKGLVHSVSYQRAHDIVGYSDLSDRMIVPESKTTKEVVERFKTAPAPLILVSPAVHTGWDFPFDAARYQMIPKVPFPDMRGALMAARSEADRSYMMQVVAEILTQMAGRIARDPKDIGETLIYDDMVAWVVGRNKRLYPRFFLNAWRWSSVNPRPPKI